MPTPAHRPPSSLAAGPFTVQEARAAGLTSRQLSGRAYRSLGYGLWVAAEGGDEDMAAPETAAELRARVRAVLAVTPGSVASHLTAAQLLGLRLPRRLRQTTMLHLTRVRGVAEPRRQGVIGHRCVVDRRDILRQGQLLATSPLRTFADLAAMRNASGPVLSDVELVALADGLICAHRTGPRTGASSWCRPDELMASLERFARVHGIPRARRAAARAMPAVDSMLETRIRMVLEDHGLSGWETDVELRAPDGTRLWPDLADRRHRISVQVEGPHHDALHQRERDIRRARTTEALGWREVRLTSRDLRPSSWAAEEPRAVELIRAARQHQVGAIVRSNPLDQR